MDLYDMSSVKNNFLILEETSNEMYLIIKIRVAPYFQEQHFICM